MDKKAILAEEVLRIVLGVLGIIVLIILAVGLYGIFTTKSDLEQASATLEDLDMKIGESKEKTGEYLLLAPLKWYLRSYQSEDENIPKDCEFNFNSCLCLCKDLNCNERDLVCKKYKLNVLVDEDYTSTQIIPGYGALPAKTLINVLGKNTIFIDSFKNLVILNEGGQVKIKLKNEIK